MRGQPFGQRLGAPSCRSGAGSLHVMAQMGHTTANLTLSIYARQMDRRDGEPQRLKALVKGQTSDIPLPQPKRPGSLVAAP